MLLCGRKIEHENPVRSDPPIETQCLEAVRLRGGKQLAVRQLRPASLPSRYNLVP